MKPAGTLTIVCVILFHSILTAQAQNPYPAAIGDTWEYMTFDALSGTRGVARNTVLSRSLRSDGMYLITYSHARQAAYDSAGYVYWIDSEDSLNLWLNLNAAQGEVYDNDGKDMTVDSVYSSIIFDSVRTVHRFSVWWGGAHTGSRMAAWTVAEGIGILLSESFEPDYYFETLTGAIIDGDNFGQTLGIEDSESDKPTFFHLAQNYPNPVSTITTIPFTIIKPEHVRLSICDVLGREVAVLIDGERMAGDQSVSFNASRLRAGIYFSVLRTGTGVETKKMLVMNQTAGF